MPLVMGVHATHQFLSPGLTLMGMKPVTHGCPKMDPMQVSPSTGDIASVIDNDTHSSSVTNASLWHSDVTAAIKMIPTQAAHHSYSSTRHHVCRDRHNFYATTVFPCNFTTTGSFSVQSYTTQNMRSSLTPSSTCTSPKPILVSQLFYNYLLKHFAKSN